MLEKSLGQTTSEKLTGSDFVFMASVLSHSLGAMVEDRISFLMEKIRNRGESDLESATKESQSKLSLQRALGEETRARSNEIEIKYDKEKALAALNIILDKYGEKLQRQERLDIVTRIGCIFDDFEGNSPEFDAIFQGSESAFVVHSTQLPDNPSSFANIDVTVCSRPLAQVIRDFPESANEIYHFFVDQVPPFRAGVITNQIGEKEVKTTILVVPMDIKQLTRVTNGLTGFMYSRRVATLLAKYHQSIKWLKDQKGISIFGLGATGASNTKNGGTVRQMFSEGEIITTTGHPTTVAVMIKTMDTLEKAHQVDFTEKKLAVFGNGRIGSGFILEYIRILTDEMTKAQRTSEQLPELILFDRKPQFAIRLAAQLLEINPQLSLTILTDKKLSKSSLEQLKLINHSEVKVKHEQVDSRNEAIVKSARDKAFIVGADTTIQPEKFSDDDSQRVQEAGVLDDSVPHLMENEIEPIHVTASLNPAVYKRQGLDVSDGLLVLTDRMDYGDLLISSEAGVATFGCEFELGVVAGSEDPSNNAVTGSVTSENVRRSLRTIQRLADQDLLKISLDVMQGYGQYRFPQN